jgi:DNA-binding MarR family transcriptional regulator
MSRVNEPERDRIDALLEELAQIPALDLEVEGLVDRINLLSRRIRRSLDATLTGFDLSYREWKMLGELRSAPSRRRSPGELARHADLSSGAMTNRLDRLERAGLVRRLPDPDDRRGVQVELTAEGLALWEAAVGVQAEKEKLIASALDEDEKRELNALLRRLMLSFERHEQRLTEEAGS